MSCEFLCCTLAKALLTSSLLIYTRNIPYSSLHPIDTLGFFFHSELSVQFVIYKSMWVFELMRMHSCESCVVCVCIYLDVNVCVCVCVCVWEDRIFSISFHVFIFSYIRAVSHFPLIFFTRLLGFAQEANFYSTVVMFFLYSLPVSVQTSISRFLSIFRNLSMCLFFLFECFWKTIWK